MPVARGLLDEWDTLPVTHRRELLSRLARAIVVEPAAQRWGRATVRVVPVWEPEPVIPAPGTQDGTGGPGEPETAGDHDQPNPVL